MELKCTFKGWPRPRVVWSWYRDSDKKQINMINGSEGFHISEQQDREDTLISLLRNANIQEKHAGAYECTGMNNITSWSTKISAFIDLNYRCESFNFLFLITTHGCTKLPPLKQAHKTHNSHNTIVSPVSNGKYPI